MAGVAPAREVSQALGGAPASADAILAMRGVVEAVSAETDPDATAARDAALGPLGPEDTLPRDVPDPRSDGDEPRRGPHLAPIRQRIV